MCACARAAMGGRVDKPRTACTRGWMKDTSVRRARVSLEIMRDAPIGQLEVLGAAAMVFREMT